MINPWHQRRRCCNPTWTFSVAAASWLFQESVPCEDFASCGVVSDSIHTRRCFDIFKVNLKTFGFVIHSQLVWFDIVGSTSMWLFKKWWDEIEPISFYATEAQFQNRTFPKNVKQQARVWIVMVSILSLVPCKSDHGRKLRWKPWEYFSHVALWLLETLENWQLMAETKCRTPTSWWKTWVSPLVSVWEVLTGWPCMDTCSDVGSEACNSYHEFASEDDLNCKGVVDGHGECGELCAAFIRAELQSNFSEANWFCRKVFERSFLGRHLPTQLAQSRHFAEGLLLTIWIRMLICSVVVFIYPYLQILLFCFFSRTLGIFHTFLQGDNDKILWNKN